MMEVDIKAASHSSLQQGQASLVECAIESMSNFSIGWLYYDWL